MVATFLLFHSRNTQQCQHRSKGCCITTVTVFLVLNTNKQIFFVSNIKSLDLYSSKQPALQSNILPLTTRSKHLHNDTHNAPGRAPRIHYCAETRKNSHLLPFKSDSVAFSSSAPASKKIHFFFYPFHVGRVSLCENLHRGRLWSSVQTAGRKLLTQLSGGK